MTNRERAMEFVASFCAGDVGAIEQLLAEDLVFRGPLVQSDTREEYIKTLRADPPVVVSYTVLSITDNDSEVVVFYEYKKPEEVLTIAQLFQFTEQQRIKKSILVFVVGSLVG